MSLTDPDAIRAGKWRALQDRNEKLEAVVQRLAESDLVIAYDCPRCNEHKRSDAPLCAWHMAQELLGSA